MSAQTSAPDVVVRQAFQALAQRDWAAFAAQVHPASIDKVRQSALGMLILVAEQRKAGQRVGGGFNPGEVVIADHLVSVGHVPATRFGSTTIAELAALPPRDFFIRWCMATYGSPRSAVQDPADLQRQVVGYLVQGDTAEVVYRQELRSQHNDELLIDLPGTVEVVVVHRLDGEWRMYLDHELAHGDVTGMFDGFHEFAMPRPLHRSVSGSSDPPGPPAHAQARPAPADVMEAAFEAMSRLEWSTFAGLIDSARLVRFQQEEVSGIIQQVGFQHEALVTGNGWTAYSVPRTVEPRRLATVDTLRLKSLPGTPTIGELARLSPVGFFKWWCEAVFGRADSPFPVDSLDRQHVVGHVFDGPELAHVLYYAERSRGDDEVFYWTMPLRFTPDGWRMLLNEHIGSPSQLGLILMSGQP